MKLAFIILAHDNPHRVISLARQLTEAGDTVVIHWDLRSRFDLQAFAKEQLTDDESSRVLFAVRTEVRWGEWGMVEATLNAMECLTERTDLDYVYLLSASDALIKPLEALKQHLARHKGRNFIECVNPRTNKWVIRGLVHERYRHFHFLNWKDTPKLFSFMHRLQKIFNIKRSVPDNMAVYFGSQWWCLTYSLAMKILGKARTEAVRRFFKHTSVPDEMFFQTLAASFENPVTFLPQLTYYRFDSKGKPLVFYNDHLEFIKTLPHFFIRKVSEQADLIHDFLFTKKEAPYNALDFHNTHAFYIPQVPKGDQLFYGNLVHNTQPYFCLLSFNPELLAATYQKFPHGQGRNVFLNLFDEDALVYGPQTPVHPSYDPDMTQLRDYAPMTLIHSFLQYFNKDTNVFCFLPYQNDDFKPLFWDTNACRIFLLPSYITDNLQISFTQKAFAVELPAVPFRILGSHRMAQDFTNGLGNWEVFSTYIQECLKHDLPFFLLNETQALDDLLSITDQTRTVKKSRLKAEGITAASPKKGTKAAHSEQQFKTDRV